ncbi:hypothetical protein [Gloeobacter kilaueensis]|uniref:Lipoprotein n=1 Tax=Gloeobacter kilaueensis (strain ATCC BAA-2537 / CCAP 1431/1 / ULC 316 / JS1) TaxID=1183438 RepID=U5QHW6_GLOK1|nr:hypothetical protein [Gloeobacter kilaueensis]AGY57219.1 hypothetical protein GKIL_0973 [Gloeobacter kilaueensis JS1]
MKRIDIVIGWVVVLALLTGCSANTRPANIGSEQSKAARSKGLVAGVRTPEGIILQVKKAERLSASEAKLSVRLFNPGAVPLPQKIGPNNFYVSPNEGTADPVAGYEPTKTTLPQKEIAPREAAEGDVYLKLPDPGTVKVYYGDTPEVSVFVLRIAPANS